MKILQNNAQDPKWRKHGNMRVLEEPIILSLHVSDGPRTGWLRVDLPAGWATDGASVPHAFRWFAGHPFDQELQTAFMWHDAIYAGHFNSRAFADALYEALLADAGVSWIKRKMHYQALRIGGGSAWKDESVNEIQAARRSIGWLEEWMGK